MENKMIKVDTNICRKCEYYWGETNGSYQRMVDYITEDYVALCRYYVDTGKHRCDDFDPDKKKKPNQNLGLCNKFTPRVTERHKADVLPIKRTYLENIRGYWQ